jgi:16S rRNA (guanine527-N7)-methyltransferase
MTAPQSAIDALGALGVELEPRDLDTLGRYLDALYGANASMNLTAVPEGEDAWHRHVVDSLSLLPWVASTGAATAIDVGTGGGLPGIPLALAVPELRMTLLEATGRKCEFLQQCVADLGLKDRCPVVNLRAEVAGHRPELRERFDLCVSRAVARLPILLEYCIAFPKPGGHIVLIKGEQAQAEIDESKKALHSLHAQVVESVRTPTGTIVAVEKLRGAPKMYPRGDGEPKRRPL